MALPTAWIPGVNAPAFGRGKFHVLNEAGHQIVGNMLTNMDRVPAEVFINLHSAFGRAKEPLPGTTRLCDRASVRGLSRDSAQFEGQIADTWVTFQHVEQKRCARFFPF